jgi:flagellar motor protein MotB
MGLLAEMALEMPDQKEGKEGKIKIEVENPLGEHAEITKIRDSLLINVEGRVLFDEGSARLKEEGRQTLTRIRDRLIGYPNRIKVVGHASPVPLSPNSPYSDHYTLAFQRALAVKSLLTGSETGEKGILEQRIEVASRGAHDLIDGVDLFDRAERARLSRVEIIVTPENAIPAARRLGATDIDRDDR